jgi:dTDP-4-amino-4,6-dideoxygalactose transaminase
MSDPLLRLVDMGRIHAPIRDAMDAAMKAVIDRGSFILGPEVREFEADFAAYCGTRKAVALDNGTSALELSLRAFGIGPGDDVIVPAMTFVATASSVLMVGAHPVLVDADPATYCLDIRKALAKVTPKTKAVIPVHLYGYPAPITPLVESGRGKFLVLEDCCQGHGARLGGKRVGSIGDAGAFSFYPAKNIGCFGDGGMAVTNDEAVAAKIAMLRNYGEAKKYEHLYLAYNRRLDTVQAAVLKVKLPFLDRWNAERRTAAQLYRQALAGTSLVLPPDCAGAGAAGGDEHVYYMFVVRSKRRDELAAALKARNIETGIHYPFPLHLLPVFQDLGHRAGDFPVAEGLAREALSLPIFPGITEDEIARVADAVRAFERGS